MDPNVVIARLRIPLVLLGVVLLVVGMIVEVLALVGLPVLVVGLACYFLLGRVRAEAVPLRPPVTGRWEAVNSPANRVPSHGLHAWGQTYALDLVHDPLDRRRPAFGSGPSFMRPDDFPAFGQPVLAPADGVVVRVSDGARDHLARNTWPGLLYLLAEGSVRELFGPGRILGNHVVLDLGGGVYAVLAHLRRGSVTVAAGDGVRVGQQVAECGNSGNSSEPHLHVQLMDHPRASIAAGLPFEFEGIETEGGPRRGVPRNGEAIVVPA